MSDSSDSATDNKVKADNAATTTAAEPEWKTYLHYFQYAYSLALLVFSVTVVMAAMFTDQTKMTDEGMPPIAAFFIFWFLIIWLATMEGGQGALVGLQPIDKTLFMNSHPISFKNTSVAHFESNMERFIVGRQFLVVLVVFVINLMASAIPDASVLNLSSTMVEIFLGSGIALILTTITLGQLTAQVNAANCMLDFINNYFMTFTVYVSLAIETSGLLHSVYLVQIIFAKIAGKQDELDSPTKKSTTSKFLFWIRVVASLTILGFAFAVTLSALFQGKTTMYEGVPEAVSVIIFFVLMCFVGLMEGMQIALFAVVNLPQEELEQHHAAKRVCELTFHGRNLQAFLIGRQIMVTICMFIVARITAVNVDTATDDSENIFTMKDGMQAFFNTGLLGAVITTVVASLAWRIVASSFPVAFLSNPLIYIIIRLCLILEASGICSAAWLLAYVQKLVMGYEMDEVFIGTPDERASSGGVNAGVLADLELQGETPKIS